MSKARVRGPIPEVFETDARQLVDKLGAGSVAGVVTSPPYAGTYDYAEQHRLRFDFLGIRHRAFDEGEIGAAEAAHRRRAHEHVPAGPRRARLMAVHEVRELLARLPPDPHTR